MLKPAIIINELDAERIDMLLEHPEFASSPVAQALNAEIDRAEIVAPGEVPADVVTMNSRVRFIDLSTQEERTRTLVFPHDLKDSAEQLSVMAPIGAALLGMRAGNDISWHLPNGTVTQIKVLEIISQPKAS
ncbi:nucleoside diphosphate kinase regulator [Budviciaceae bacterium CWB-B4]|uniref:Nucleoside diphosphate kinase regulator n=1 Tax=Limnobaculum xujianqingii TaxID=2738837 RepID=A0A9D7AEX9_9GAMM|nr:nucleoside diphosphate kinase regulator [Limnobaculum xujianqingii]MBK5071481.1 nucleoside diphosphate kinase regulator [Limnobaculum xujianqingii]MBK5174790.1 nucleoside diphosphate kinase regulator [Limnobaculum xujianqingii]